MISLDRQLSVKEHDDARKRYTRHVCHAVNAFPLDTLLRCLRSSQWSAPVDTKARYLDEIAVAAAVGNLPMFMDHVCDARDIFRAYEHFPNALNAAVVAGHDDLVDYIVTYVLQHVTELGCGGYETQSEMRSAAEGMYEALLVAIRPHHHAAANTRFRAFAKNKALSRLVPLGQRSDMFANSIIHGNVKFYKHAALQANLHLRWQTWQSSRTPRGRCHLPLRSLRQVDAASTAQNEATRPQLRWWEYHTNNPGIQSSEARTCRGPRSSGRPHRWETASWRADSDHAGYEIWVGR